MCEWCFLWVGINEFGGRASFVIVVHFVDGFFLVSNWVRPQLYRFSMINGSFLVIVGSTRAFLSVLLSGSKTVRATGAIDVLGSFGCQGLLL